MKKLRYCHPIYNFISVHKLARYSGVRRIVDVAWWMHKIISWSCRTRWRHGITCIITDHIYHLLLCAPLSSLSCPLVCFTARIVRPSTESLEILKRRLKPFRLAEVVKIQFLQCAADFWAAVCKTVCRLRPMLSDSCLSCLSCLCVLSVTLVHCDQTVGRIKIKLGVQVGLGVGHIVLHGDPAPPPQKGAELSNFRPILLWPNGWMHQDATWYGKKF